MTLMETMHRHRYSFTAGVCAAGGSFFGKLSSFLAAQRVFLHQLPLPSTTLFSPEVGGYLEFALLHALPFALMLVCNVLNWRYFLKALQASEQQTLMVTVLCAASNYMVSFILAAVIYHEPISWLSVLGSSLIVAGLWFLCGGGDDDDHIQTKTKRKRN